MTIELGGILAAVGLLLRLTMTSATRADVADVRTVVAAQGDRLATLGERMAHVEGLLAPRPDPPATRRQATRESIALD